MCVCVVCVCGVCVHTRGSYKHCHALVVKCAAPLEREFSRACVRSSGSRVRAFQWFSLLRARAHTHTHTHTHTALFVIARLGGDHCGLFAGSFSCTFVPMRTGGIGFSHGLAHSFPIRAVSVRVLVIVQIVGRMVPIIDRQVQFWWNHGNVWWRIRGHCQCGTVQGARRVRFGSG
jgi:hypothetical protein